MATPAGRVVIDPQGTSCVLSFTGGQLFTDGGCSIPASFPQTVTAATTFYALQSRTFTLSAKFSGAENANGNGGTLPVFIGDNSGQYVTVQPSPTTADTTADASVYAPLASPALTGTPTINGSNALNLATANATYGTLTGLLTARPGAASNTCKYYFATDDAGGTLYVTNGTAWSPVGPRGELGYASIAASVTLSASKTAVAGLATTVTVGSRPIYVDFFTPLCYAATAGQYVFIVIQEDGVDIQGADLFCPTGGSGAAVWASVRRNPTPGAHTYSISANTGSGAGTIFSAAEPLTFMRVIEA